MAKEESVSDQCQIMAGGQLRFPGYAWEVIELIRDDDSYMWYQGHGYVDVYPRSKRDELILLEILGPPKDARG